jgi:hypothetical protein
MDDVNVTIHIDTLTVELGAADAAAVAAGRVDALAPAILAVLREREVLPRLPGVGEPIIREIS